MSVTVGARAMAVAVMGSPEPAYALLGFAHLVEEQTTVPRAVVFDVGLMAFQMGAPLSSILASDPDSWASFYFLNPDTFLERAVLVFSAACHGFGDWWPA